MAREAEDVERLVASIPDPPKRGRKGKIPPPAQTPPVTGGTVQSTAAPAEDVRKVETTLVDWEPLNLGPEFPIMMVSLVQVGTDMMAKRSGWTDPGLLWRQKFGEALARVIERLLGRLFHGRQEAAGDIVVLVSYLGMYVVTNMILHRQNPPKQIERVK